MITYTDETGRTYLVHVWNSDHSGVQSSQFWYKEEEKIIHWMVTEQQEDMMQKKENNDLLNTIWWHTILLLGLVNDLVTPEMQIKNKKQTK